MPTYRRIHEKLRPLLYYVHTTTYNQINCNWTHVLIIHFYRLVWFNKQRRFHFNLSARVSYSGHPVTYCSFTWTILVTKYTAGCKHTPHNIIRFYIIRRFYIWRHFCASLSPAQDILLHVRMLHTTSYASTQSCHYTYKDIFCASLSPA